MFSVCGITLGMLEFTFAKETDSEIASDNLLDTDCDTETEASCLLERQLKSL